MTSLVHFTASSSLNSLDQPIAATSVHLYVLLDPPEDFHTLESLLVKIYSYIFLKNPKLESTVLLRGASPVPEECAMLDDASPAQVHNPPLMSVAVGGTFDHLHIGHKLLLTATVFLAKKHVFVGVTDDVLLINKSHREQLEPITLRIAKVKEFLKRLNPVLKYTVVAIRDIYGPTITEKDIQGLVISTETKEGGDRINQERKRKGWNDLLIYEIQLYKYEGETEKVSSTTIRINLARESEKKDY
ncbi:hypothetical protein NEOLI_003039 [Neolecta irregularis DAH-3]|uniref:Cytidyltransferase-like domain-containing protein n=1 Tax=Neolecta irregularis (strain DAH-3) TaxID=1198029 RepID=A0A1U7LTZ7_NEOID|nr:hypothetical protein NEOLI_003039 [Neolecta irregularis DAH-3]|eukprot:OLL26137.1 hypothetical protein NEOLI_003039 [Neolecta irregularis DAH-3]